jgi:hypothetical protein
MAFPDTFDPHYFSAKAWKDRLQDWLGGASGGFAAANVQSIERMLADPRTSVRIVINIRPDALMKFLEEGRYRNVYEMPLIGGSKPDQNRLDADAKMGTGAKHYFAVAAMGGVGIRYFGEYCMVLRLDFAKPDTQLFDRDSYDVLFPPLAGLPNHDIDCIKGRWGMDIAPMLLLRVLPELQHERQIVTSGTVIELALKDQEFIEVHLEQTITPHDIDQVIESPDTAAMEARILERQRNGLPNRMHELEWVRRRNEVARRLEKQGIRQRVVTQTGRGFQWR